MDPVEFKFQSSTIPDLV